MSVPNSQARLPKQKHVSKLDKNESEPVKSRRWFGLGLSLTGVAMLSATVGALLAVYFSSKPLLHRQLSPEEEAVFNGDRISGSGLQFSTLTRPVNLLVMGMSVLPEDTRNPPANSLHLSYSPQLNSFDGLSDVMLLLRFDPQTGKLVVLSIPRDTRIPIAGHGTQKINAANEVGGVALSAKTVSSLLDGVAIDRYIRINILGVSKLIDALGGVNIYVPKDMHYKDDTQHLYVNLKAGWQHLDGDQALQLLRFRHDALGDIGRIQRQQLVMRALVEQALNSTTLTRLPQILSVVQSHIDTNLSVQELMGLVSFAVQTQRENVQMLMVPGRFSEPDEYASSYWLPNSKGITSLMAQYFELGSGLPSLVKDPSTVNIAIQDSTNQPQAVKALVKILKVAGYQNINIERPWQEPLQNTHLIAEQGDSDRAQAIQKALGFGEVRVDSTGVLGSDVTIQLGGDWRPLLEHQQ